MSQWTHVNCSIRIDSIRNIENLNLVNDLGKIETYESLSDSEENECKLPLGSEGSLCYTIWENPSDSSLAAFTVNIFGDLRDYDNENEIVKFLNNFVHNKMIRSGILEIDVEGLPTVVYQYHYNNKKFVKIYSGRENQL